MRSLWPRLRRLLTLFLKIEVNLEGKTRGFEVISEVFNGLRDDWRILYFLWIDSRENDM